MSPETIKMVEKNIAEINPKPTDRARVNAWLDSIGEDDPACRAEVMDACAKDKGARAYYVERIGK